MSGITLTTCAIGLMGVTPEAFVQRAQEILETRAVATDEKTIEGEIVKVEEDQASFVLRIAGGEDEKIVIRVNDKTSFMLDDKPTTRAQALVVGRRAKVTHEERIASRVAAFSE